MKIKQKNFLITTILLIGSLFVFSKAQAAVQNITSCGSLDTISTTYVLQNDVISDGQCFNINANNIVLDLNGHTVTYNNVSGDEVYGITTNWNRDGIRITNGTIRQGIGNGYQSDVIHPLQASNVEIDHLNIYYQGENVTGIEINGGSYAHDANVHDNMIYPNSNKRIDSVLGYASHYGGFSVIDVPATGGKISIKNNYIEGKGFSGISFGYNGTTPPTGTVEINDNTVKMASPIRDGYAIAIGSGIAANVGFEIARNTIVQSSGRGILVAGDYNANSPGPGLGDVHDNSVDVREAEDTGEYLNAPGTGVGIQLRFGAHDVKIYNNNVSVHAGKDACPAQFPESTGSDCMAIGIKVIAGQTAINNQVYNNAVTAETNDPASNLNAIGLYGDGISDGSNIFYGNTITSNSILADVNDNDGGGSGFIFKSNNFIKGANPQNFHSIKVGNWIQSSTDNVFLDNIWSNGAGVDDILNAGSSDNGTFGNYSLFSKWYLNIAVKDASTNLPVIGANVSAIAGVNETIAGITDTNGNAQLVLTDYKRYGTTYPATTNYLQYTPHNLTIKKAGYDDNTSTVTMDATKSVNILMSSGSYSLDAVPPTAPTGLMIQ